MTIKIMLLPALFLSGCTFAATPQAVKPPSELKWSYGEEKSNCIGRVCVQLEDNNKPGMFDRVDQTDRQRLKDPFASHDSDNGDYHKTLTFSFGDSN